MKMLLRCSLLFTFVLGFTKLFALDLFIAPNGNDQNAGSRDKPFATLKGARDAIRDLRHQGKLKESVNVFVLQGTYWMSEPLLLTPEDAGTAEAPVTFLCAPGQRAEFLGGIQVKNLEKTSDGLWKAHIPETVQYGWRFEQLYVNGKRAVRARTPNLGAFLSIRKVDDFVLDSGDRVARFAVQKIMAHPNEVASLRNLKDGELRGALLTFYHHWDNTRKFVSAYNAVTSTFFTIGTGMKPWNPINTESKFFIENYREALDAPNEWYLDNDGTLYYKPGPGETIESANVVAPRIEQFIIIKGSAGRYVQHLRFENLSFKVAGYITPPQGNEAAQAAAPVNAVVIADYAKNIQFENCEIANTGVGAIWFREACEYNKVVHCYLHDLGGGGIKIGSTADVTNNNNYSRNNVVDNNIIRSVGWVFPCAVGVAIFHSSDNQVTHNEIADLRYTGISVGWIWGYTTSVAKRNIVKYNHIHHIGWGELSDMGGVYTLGQSEGTIVSNNNIHHVYSLTYGGWGLYTDEGSTGIVMENNLVYACKSSGFHQHYGRDNIIRNNIFALNIVAQLQATRVELHNSFSFTNNIIFYSGGTLLSGRWDSIQLKTDLNCYFDSRSGDIRFGKYSFTQWQQRGHDTHSIVADPGFVNPYAFDFSLKNNNVARKIKFVPFNFNEAGVYGDREWLQLARFDEQLAKKFDAIMTQK